MNKKVKSPKKLKPLKIKLTPQIKKVGKKIDLIRQEMQKDLQKNPKLQIQQQKMVKKFKNAKNYAEFKKEMEKEMKKNPEYKKFIEEQKKKYQKEIKNLVKNMNLKN
jgi:regulator of replication initiation timing